MLVVESPASWALREGTERGLIECVVESPVSDVSGENSFLFVGRNG